MRIAFVFPGQGSQSVGMLSGFADNAVVADYMARANAALGEDLVKLIAEGPAEVLSLTVNTQPALLAASAAFYEAWIAAGGRRPDVMAGHSLGEYSALTSAGTFAFEDAVKLVRFRAQAMQEAVPVGVGGMAAVIGLDDEAVIEACREASAVGPVEPVNFNSPGQVVIAGRSDGLAKAVELLKARGCRRAIPLAVLAPAGERLAKHLAEVKVSAPSVPVYANVTAQLHTTPDEIRALLAQQVSSAVQWTKIVKAMEASGVTDIVECGPGKVLTGLVKRIAPEIRLHGISSEATLEATLEALAA